LAPLAAALLLACAAHAQGARQRIDLAPAPLDRAVGALARQAGVQVVLSSELAQGRSAPALHGDYTPREALERLVAGSGLVVRAQDEKTFTVEPAPPTPAAQGTLGEVTVTAQLPDGETATSPVPGYIARRAATALKTDTPLAETPQSVTVVTSDQMTDQGATSMEGAMNYAAGVRSGVWGFDTRGDWLLVRGSEPTLYLDGLQQYTEGYGWQTNTREDPYMLERVEVLRGPAGMLYGAGSTAGLVNMVSKRPLQEAQREVGVSLGSFNRRQVQADLTGPLTEDGVWSYRLIALARKSDTQVDYVPDDRSLIAPSLSWRPNAATSVTLQGLWQENKSGQSAQFFPWAGTLLPNPNGQLPSSRFIGEPGDYFNGSRRSFGWQVEHRFSDTLVFRQSARVARNVIENDYHTNAFWLGAWADDPINQRLLTRAHFRQHYRNQVGGIDNHLEASFDTGAVKHKLLLGADYSRQKFDMKSGSGPTSLIDAYAPVYGVSNDPITEFSFLRQTATRNAGIYVSDQMRWQDWILVAGLRHDRSTSDTDTNFGAGEPETTQANTKRLGLIYASPSGWSPYLSYSESFTPQSGTTEEGTLFKPLRGEQIEAGLKYMPADGAISATASVYRLKEKNRIVSNPDNPLFGRQLDSTLNKGIELELKAKLSSNLSLLAYYTYIDQDRKLEGTPKNQAAVWGMYRFSAANLPGLSVGMGVRYMSAFRDLSGLDSGGEAGPRVPSVTLLDLMLGYETGPWRFALNINNLTDKTYFSNCESTADRCWFGARRTITATATYRF
ncbi:MAG: TonB-dependent siderophore receptor, partial [Acidovorax sp.]|uniref:TonB-dependent siderophore receptor n=1 Tax=Acidovorax sp. TaxID=1872122 RepID=UPI0039E4D0A8